MKFRQLLHFPYHFLLLPVFFIWHITNDYFNLIPFKHSLRFIVYYLTLATVLYTLGLIIFRNSIKAGCWATAILIIFFFWGPVQDVLKNLHLPAFFVSYKFLVLLAVAVITFITMAYLRYKQTIPVRANIFFNILLGVLVLIEAITFIYKSSTNELGKGIPPQPALSSTGNKEKPDIFFIVFDEYMSNKGLKKYLGFDNTEVDSMLRYHDFYVADNSMSNYNFTPHSIASNLNLDYFNLPLEGKSTDPRTILEGRYLFQKAYLPQFLEKEGYEIINYGFYDLASHPATSGSSMDKFAIQLLYLQTLWGRFEKDLSWNFSTFNNVFARQSKEEELIINTNKESLASLLKDFNTPSSRPRFVFAHIMLPHEPYLLDKNGERRKIIYSKDHAVMDSFYLGQLQYASKWIESISYSAYQYKKRPLVVIIEGDHGYRDAPDKIKLRDKQFMNLYSVYFSDHDYSLLYDSISPVNSFRVVLNKYFDSKLPLLKDSTILLY